MLCESIRYVGVLIAPTMPRTPARIFAQLGLTDAALMTLASLETFGGLPAGTVGCKGEALFPRIDIQQELADILPTPKAEPKPEAKPAQKKPETKQAEPLPEGVIGIDDFAKVQLRVARVLAAEKVDGSDKLLKLRLRLTESEPERTVVSGIAKFYTPEDMVGRQVVLVANLKPAKLRGIVSEGMILCASDSADTVLKLVSVGEGMEDGASVR